MPSCSMIFAADPSMNGAIRTAAILSASNRLWRFVSRRELLAGSFARMQGSRSTMYLFVTLMNYQIAISALWRPRFSKQVCTSAAVRKALSWRMR